MTSFKNLKSEKKDSNSKQFFFRKKSQDDNGKNCNSVLMTFDSIYNYYSSLQNNELYKSMKIKDCYSLILAEAVIEKLSKEKIHTGKDNSFPESFYNQLADTLVKENDDRELIVIYLKQITNIMKRGGLILFHDRIAVAADPLMKKESLYFRLLESFWNKSDWSEIFPSSPESAHRLHEKRNNFAELLQSFYTEVSIEDLCNDYFEMTDLCDQNDYFMISFLDFYLITWLKHFGIIDYVNRKNTEIVFLSIQDYGRDIIRKIL
jgi:hypothetical protein